MTEVEQCIFENAYEKTLKNPKYIKHTERMIYLGRKIMEYLGPYASLFLEYEISSNLAKGIRLEEIYQLGLENGAVQSKQLL